MQFGMPLGMPLIVVPATFYMFAIDRGAEWFFKVVVSVMEICEALEAEGDGSGFWV